MPAPSLAPSLASQHGRLQRDQGLLPTFGPHPKLARAPQFCEGRDSVTAYHHPPPDSKRHKGPGMTPQVMPRPQYKSASVYPSIK